MHGVLGTLAVKLVGTVFIVSSGLVCGPEGTSTEAPYQTAAPAAPRVVFIFAARILNATGQRKSTRLRP